MNRKEFLKTIGVAGASSLLPMGSISRVIAKAIPSNESPLTGCVLIPQETSGPYPFDLSSNAAMFRQDITEGNAGTPLNLVLSFVDVNNSCAPITNARVDIWHCNKDGYYSEYGNQPGYLGNKSYVGQTFFRGIQLTDYMGTAQFTTIYPGWYGGRVTHIHFQVFLNSVLSATSQACFPNALNISVNNTSLYSAHGQNTLTNSTDNVFSDAANTQYETLTVSPNATTGGYDASLTVGIAVPKAGVINLSPEIGAQFTLRQNYPNPFASETTIAFTLLNDAQVRLELFNLLGARVLTIFDKHLEAGDRSVLLNRGVLSQQLTAGNYVYQLTVENRSGTFRQCKVLSVQ